jgi:hypothetical protein
MMKKHAQLCRARALAPMIALVTTLGVMTGCPGDGAGTTAPSAPAGVQTDPSGGFADTGTYLRDVDVSTGAELATALGNAQPGDRIVLAPGTYAAGLYQQDLQGTALNPIMIAGDPSGGTVLSGSSGSMQLADPAYVVIQDLELEGASGNAIQAKGGTEDVLIWRNRFERAGERAINLGGSTGVDWFRPQGADYEARNVQAIANILSDCKAPVAFVGCDGALVANNTIYLPQTWVMRILQESVTGYIPCRNGRFVDNIVVFNNADLSTYVNIGPDAAPETFLLSHNLWYSLDNAAFAGPSLPTTETDALYQLDPLFASPAAAGGDFHLDAASPARSAGAALDEVPGDYDQNPYSDPPSIGAFEYGD